MSLLLVVFICSTTLGTGQATMQLEEVMQELDALKAQVAELLPLKVQVAELTAAVEKYAATSIRSDETASSATSDAPVTGSRLCAMVCRRRLLTMLASLCGCSIRAAMGHNTHWLARIQQQSLDGSVEVTQLRSVQTHHLHVRQPSSCPL